LGGKRKAGKDDVQAPAEKRSRAQEPEPAPLTAPPPGNKLCGKHNISFSKRCRLCNQMQTWKSHVTTGKKTGEMEQPGNFAEHLPALRKLYPEDQYPDIADVWNAVKPDR
jgi:hypothetical protein